MCQLLTQGKEEVNQHFNKKTTSCFLIFRLNKKPIKPPACSVVSHLPCERVGQTSSHLTPQENWKCQKPWILWRRCCLQQVPVYQLCQRTFKDKTFKTIRETEMISFTCLKKVMPDLLTLQEVYYGSSTVLCFRTSATDSRWKDRHDDRNLHCAGAEMSVKILREHGFPNGIITFVKATVEKPIHNLTQMGCEIWRSFYVKQQAAWSVSRVISQVTFYWLYCSINVSYCNNTSLSAYSRFI